MSHTQTHQLLQQDNAAAQLVEAQTIHLDVVTCAVLPNLTLEGDAATWQADRGIWQIDFGMPDTSVGSGFNNWPVSQHRLSWNKSPRFPCG